MSKRDNFDKKEYIRKKMLESQMEAKIVRKTVMIILIVLFVIISGTTLGGYFFIRGAIQPVDPDEKETKNVEIPIGSTLDSISTILEENGIIKNATIFKYYVKFNNESGFMAGNYQLSPSMTFNEIVSELKTGLVEEEAVFTITIPEGKQLREIAKIVSEKTDYSEEEFFTSINDEQFVRGLMEKYPTLLSEEIFAKNIKYPLEGYLFPATYSYYSEKPTIEEIITPMLDKTEEVLKEYHEIMEEQNMSVHDLLTMASLIEEEATEKVDREQISSVFYNRLEIGMPLQTDPTVLYAHGRHKERVLYADLEIEDPYNTYIHTGLTPGPISNAGISSIEAALYPADTDYMYFLATPTGEVLFSKTLDEHNEKKAKHIQS